MNGATHVVSRIGSALRGILGSRSKSREFADAEKQRSAAVSLRDGYREVSVPGGSVFIESQTEAAYFQTEEEFSPVVMNVRNSAFAEANAGATRRVRFEDPAEEFINAAPRAPRVEIDYSVFTQRAAVTPSETTHAVQVSTVDVVSSDNEEIAAPVVTAEPVEIQIPVSDAVVQTPASLAPVEDQVVVSVVAEDSPVVVSDVIEAPSVEVVRADVTPVDDEPRVEICSESVEDEAVAERTPAEEISAITGIGFAGMPMEGVMTSEAAVMPVMPAFSLSREEDVVTAFDPQIAVESDDLQTFDAGELPAVADDGLEALCFEPVKVEPVSVSIPEDAAPAPITEEVVALEPAPVEVTETPVDVVDVPVVEDVAEVEPVEVPVEEAPVEPVVEVTETPVDVVDAPVVEDVAEVEPVVEDVAEVEPVEVPVEVAPVEPVVEVTETVAVDKKESAPSIISHRAVDPADVAAILFG